MIQILSKIEKLSLKLETMLKSSVVSDYKAVFDSTNRITVYLKGCSLSLEDASKIFTEFDVSSTVLLDEDDDSYDFLFEEGEKVDVTTSRLRLDNMLSNSTNENDTNIPVLTFYSYKGGVGRSTTVASFASFLSIKKGMKVVILDCDFEAPGFTNFFLDDTSELYYKNGIIEYLFDSAGNKSIPLSSYYWETSKKYSGKGSIFVFPSGNLSADFVSDESSDTHLDHYLQGLSRLDIFSTDTLVGQLSSLLNSISTDLAPDVILIDSRTGFNDVFGITAFRLSNIVLGLFGDDAQTIPGLYFLLNSNYQRKSSTRLILANSIIPAFAKSKLFAHFKEKVRDFLSEIQTEEDEKENGLATVEIFPIGYNDILKNIGLPTSSYEDYISMIENNEFIDYTNLFSRLYDEIKDIQNTVIGGSKTDSKTDSTIDLKGEVISQGQAIRKRILNSIAKCMPSMYGEDITDFELEYSNNRYYYRRCMQDLFNPEKIIVLGNKGTGKTYIYRSLSNSNIVSELRKRADKEKYDYEFVQIINDDHRFETHHLDSMIGDFSQELFFERFWEIYIWSVLVQIGRIKTPNGLVVKNDTATAQQFTKLIKNDDFIIKVEEDIRKLDEQLLQSSQGKRRIVIIFDELDSIVKPIFWSKRVSPLINYSRKMSYSCISPKLFLRSDLYNKITNINNKNELINRTISIEWNQDEMFAYLFKFILSHSKDDFISAVKSCSDLSDGSVKKIIKKLEKNSDNSPIDEYMLRYLCATLFGKYADSKQSTRYGESYDWFYTNLKNANDTISLRPFIDLLDYAVGDALKSFSPNESEQPILPAQYYVNSTVRVKAVERHFKDLANEEGNTDLKIIFDYIRDKAPDKYKRDRLWIEDFEELAQMIIETKKLVDVTDADSMLELLLVNGIVRRQYIRTYRGTAPRKAIQFALLYKYYLGLGSAKSRKRKTSL